MQGKSVNISRAVKAGIVLPPDTNNYGTMFGGRIMALIDEVAALSAMRHARMPVVTASSDSVDFLGPIQLGQSVCLESFVSWTDEKRIEVFVKVVGEDLMSGERHVCATAFLTFMAVDEDANLKPVPQVVPETNMERKLFEDGLRRAEKRRERRHRSKILAEQFGVTKPWGKLEGKVQ
jgi:acyl-CoA hydrolase